MKNFLLFFLLTIILSIQAFSQTSWEWQNPLPQGNHLNTVRFIDKNTGWAVGWLGCIVKTTNGGKNWYVVQKWGKYYLTSIHFFDANNGWISGWSGQMSVIMRTTDGGINWNTQETDTLGNINKSFFIDNNNGWIIGGSGGSNLYKTIDGGKTWILKYISDNSSFTDICFSDLNHGVAVGYKGIILQTTDGGELWNVRSYLKNAILHEVQLISNSVGWVAGDSIFIKTTDGGEHWVDVMNDPENINFNFFFLNADQGWVFSTEYYSVNLYRTSDGGNTWENMPYYNELLNLYEIYFLDANNGWIVGAEGKIIYTTDRGETWINQRPGIDSYLFSIDFVNKDTGCVIARDGTLLTTTNGGKIWEEKSTGIMNADFHSCDFVDTNLIIVVADNNVILKSTNFGNSWRLIPTDSMYRLFSVKFINRWTGWIVGENGIIFRTTDAGETWIPSVRITDNLLYSVFFVDEMTGWAAGRFGTVLKSSDGGSSWVQQVIGTDVDFYNIFFINNKIGWVVGDKLFKTTDGGEHWNQKTIPGFDDYYAIFFLSPKIGWLCSAFNLLKTTDGGNTWEILPPTTTMSLTSLFFWDSNNGWIAGGNGNIIHTPAGGNTLVEEQPIIIYDTQFRIYPNPFTNTFTIELNNDLFFEDISIYDLLGNKVKEISRYDILSSGSKTIEINAADLPNGVYFIRIGNGKAEMVVKM